MSSTDHWSDVMGTPRPAEMADAYMEFTGRVFDDVWSRPGLGRRERRMTTLTAIAVGGSSGPLEYHMRAALETGDFTVDELMEWVVHLAHYGGWPVSADAYVVLRQLAAELGAD